MKQWVLLQVQYRKKKEEGEKKKFKLYRCLFELLNWIDVNILSREPNVLYLSFAYIYIYRERERESSHNLLLVA